MLGVSWIDLPGFSTAVESYEYSKQPMNNLAFEAGAGTSLVYGPLVDTDNATGSRRDPAHLATLLQHFAASSNAREQVRVRGRDVSGEQPDRRQEPDGRR